MPAFEWLALFDREWRSLTAEQQRAFRDAVAAFVEDLREATGLRKGLRVKKMQGREDVWEMTWAPDGSATFHRRAGHLGDHAGPGDADRAGLGRDPGRGAGRAGAAWSPASRSPGGTR